LRAAGSSAVAAEPAGEGQPLREKRRQGEIHRERVVARVLATIIVSYRRIRHRGWRRWRPRPAAAGGAAGAGGAADLLRSWGRESPPSMDKRR